MRTFIHRRASRALERQLLYQRRKSEKIQGSEAQIMAGMQKHSQEVRDKLNSVRPIAADTRVLEVGSGAHGLIFFFGTNDAVGVDPLADEYKSLFPEWQGRAQTLRAFGEQLPFEDESFEVVLCDNVVDHAECPRKIVEEICRVLVPGGLLYFTVNVHHAFYHWAATAHAAWRALRIPIEITPFADHTVHLTLKAARRLFRGLPVRFLSESDTVRSTQRGAVFARHLGDQFKRLFFKNANWELIAIKEPGSQTRLAPQ